MDPIDEDSEQVILKMDRPISKFTPRPGSTLLQRPVRKVYVYYISNGELTKVNINDPTDKMVICRRGGSSYVVDPRRNQLIYVRFNRAIVKEDLETGESMDLVNGKHKLSEKFRDQNSM